MVKFSPAPRHYAAAEPVLEGEVLDKEDEAIPRDAASP